jgi:hypothetical protein
MKKKKLYILSASLLRKLEVKNMSEKLTAIENTQKYTLAMWKNFYTSSRLPCWEN